MDQGSRMLRRAILTAANERARSIDVRDFTRLLRAVSFDHLVGLSLEREWDADAERLCGPQVKQKLKLGWLQNRQVGGFGALEYLAHVGSRPAVAIANVGSVAHKTPGFDELARYVDRGNGLLRSDPHEPIPKIDQERIVSDQERLDV